MVSSISKVQDKFASISFNQWAKQIGNKKREKYITRGAVLIMGHELHQFGKFTFI
jgi:hypothetical protein